MSNIQLWLAIGIPSLLVVLSWLSNNAHFSAHDKRFDGVDRRMDALERRLDQVDRRFNEVISGQHGDALEIMRNMTALHERVAVVETKQPAWRNSRVSLLGFLVFS